MAFLQIFLVQTLGFWSCHAQYLPGMVTKVSQLSTFFKLLSSTPQLYTQVKQGGVALLAPTNDAFAAIGLTNASTVNAAELDALLRYHVLRSVHASASFSGTAEFFPTLLSNSKYTNNTGGQVVKGMGVDGASTVVSALWKQSKIVTGDIYFENGLIHMIDTVLSIPEQDPQTVTAAQLSDYVALGEHTVLVKPAYSHLVSDFLIWKDTTILAPNSPHYSTDFTGWDDLTVEQQLEIWKYHLVNGSVLFSTDLMNGSTFTTSAGLDFTAWVVDGEVYINDAKVTQPDLLQANGVIQVLDKPLDPNNTNARPASLSTISKPQPQNFSTSAAGLSSGAQAGIGVGVTVAGLALIIAVAYFLLSRRKKVQNALKVEASSNGQSESYAQASAASLTRTNPSLLADTSVNEMATKSNTWELGGSRKEQGLPAGFQVAELEGDRGRIQFL